MKKLLLTLILLLPQLLWAQSYGLYNSASGAAWPVSGGGGGATPLAPLAIKAFQTNASPTSIYGVIQMGSANGHPVTSLTANVYTTSGNTFVESCTTNALTAGSSISPVSGVPTRVDCNGLTGGTSYYMKIAEVNNQGTGLFSASSSSVTPAAWPDSFPAGGANAIALISGSANGTGGTPSCLSTYWNSSYTDSSTYACGTPGSGGYPAAPSGVSVNSEMLVTPGIGAQFYINRDNSTCFPTNNGLIQIGQMQYLEFYLYTNTAGTIAIPALETTINFYGRVSSASGGTITDTYAALPTSGYPGAGTSIFDDTGCGQSAWSSNTATTIATGYSPSVGDWYNLQQGDYAYGAGVNITSYILSPSAGSLTLGQWNLVKIPLGSGGLNILNLNNGGLYKIHINLNGPTYFAWMALTASLRPVTWIRTGRLGHIERAANDDLFGLKEAI